MRPPDENQPGSKSPQIIPHTRSKEGQNETTLARLERAGPRRGSSATGRVVRIALLGGSGLLVVGLVTSLVSLTRDNVETPPVLEAVAPAETAPEAVAQRPAPAPIDRDDRHVTTVDTADPPALVKLTTDPGDRHDAPQLAAPLPAPASTAGLPRPAPPRPVMLAKPAVATPAVAARPTPAPKAVVKPAALKSAVQGPGARKAKGVAPVARPEAPPMDTDVALLSAILSQSSRHAGERAAQEASTCAEAIALSRRCTDQAAPPRP